MIHLKNLILLIFIAFLFTNSSKKEGGPKLSSASKKNLFTKEIHKQFHSFIGNFEIYHSNIENNNEIKIIFRQTSFKKHCIFPTTGKEESIIIGDSICFFPIENELETISFNINRKDFEESELSGVIIVKDIPYNKKTAYHTLNEHPTYTMALQDCMMYLYNTGNDKYCSQFKKTNKYVSIKF